MRWLRRLFARPSPSDAARIEAAHVRIGSGAGMGQKPDDWRAVPLCSWHHRAQHQGERTFWEAYQSASGQTVDDLIEALCNSSPKRPEIQRVRKERENV